MTSITKGELATYYSLRRLTFELGISDRIYVRPRIYPQMDVGEISREFYNECLQAEEELISLHSKSVSFNAECAEADVAKWKRRAGNWERCAMGRLDEIRSLRQALGLMDDEAA